MSPRPVNFFLRALALECSNRVTAGRRGLCAGLGSDRPGNFSPGGTMDRAFARDTIGCCLALLQAGLINGLNHEIRETNEQKLAILIAGQSI